jgi:hypothetical protein
MRTALQVGLFLIAISSLARANDPNDRRTTVAVEQVGASRPGSQSGDATVLESVPVTQPSLTAIAAWLSEKYDLPRVDELPRIELVPANRLNSIRYKGLLSDQRAPSGVSGREAGPESLRQTVAVYDDARRTIFLPEGWTGTTLPEQSMLVHEMVHHLQNLGGLKYECSGAREKLAYFAQDDWLKMHGSELEKEFEIDAFTIVILAACMK